MIPLWVAMAEFDDLASTSAKSKMGAKNHAIILHDANVDATLNSLVAAGFGAAGQRCMALSTAVFVGGSEPWEAELVKRAAKLKVSAGIEPDTDLVPVITKQLNRTISGNRNAGVIEDRRSISMKSMWDDETKGALAA